MRLFGSSENAGWDVQGEAVSPGRGFYEIHPYDLNVEPVWDDIRWCVKADQSLVLLMLDIHAFRGGDIDAAALGRADRLFKIYGELGKDLIVRIVYDREGKGLENEPGLLTIVIRHMEQLGPVLKDNSGCIYVAQGLFVGDWGEMHGSKFLRNDKLVKLYETWRRAVGDIRLAVRTPAQLRSISGAHGLGLYNDGILGSETDLGTYCACEDPGDGTVGGDWGNGTNCMPEGAKYGTVGGTMDRVAELEFQDRLCIAETNGGEVVGWQGVPDAKPDAAMVIATMRKMHLSYLNSQHDLKVLGEWKEIPCGILGAWQELSLYEYVRAHLGYRFVAVGTTCDSADSRLWLDMVNTGFANIYDEVVAVAVLCDGADGMCRTEGQMCRGDRLSDDMPERGMEFDGLSIAGNCWKMAALAENDLRNLAPGGRMKIEVPVIQEGGFEEFFGRIGIKLKKSSQDCMFFKTCDHGGNMHYFELIIARKKDGRQIHCFCGMD